jgi:hypothetical protein
MPEIPIFSSPHFEVVLLEEAPIVLLTRKAHRLGSQSEVEQAFKPLLESLDVLGRHGKALLMDSRKALPNNDPEYEIWMAPYRASLIRAYAFAVFVVQTSTGQLQSRRLLKSDDKVGTSRIFGDFEEAKQFLLERKDTFRRVISIPPRRLPD